MLFRYAEHSQDGQLVPENTHHPMTSDVHLAGPTRAGGSGSSDATTHSLLTVSGASFDYHGIPALVDVSVTVEPGEAVAIVGPNGAGKTTLAKVIGGALRPRQGIVTLAGEQISGLPASQVPRHGIGIVLEGRHVFPEQSVRTNLELGAYWRRIKRDELTRDMERVLELFPDLRRAATTPAGDLSGGQQQMLAVGRALMGSPKLLLLDEPSMGLSPKLASELFGVLAALRDSGLAILLIEQNARLALELCQRAYLLQYGQVALEGRVDELRSMELIQRIYLGRDVQTPTSPTN